MKLRHARPFLIVVLLLTVSTLVFAKDKKKNEEPKQEQKILLEERELITNYKFKEDDITIYNYLKEVLLQNNKIRIEVETDKDGKFIRKQIPTSTIVISDVTAINLSKDKTYKDNTDSDKKFIISKKGETYNEAIDNYIINNQKTYDLSEFIACHKELISYKSIQEQIDTSKDPFAYWNLLYQASPTSCGHLTFSRIGYNSTSDIAVIQVEFMSGGMSGFSDYIFFKKTNKIWEVIDSLRARYY